MREYQETDVCSFPTEEDAVRYYSEWYRKYGYPGYDEDNYNPFHEIDSLVRFDEKSIRKGDTLDQTMHSCGYLWTFFPDWVNTKPSGGRSFMECWNDDKLFGELMRKAVPWVKKHDNGRWTTNRVRQLAKVYCSKQSVSNFRPSVAKYIYNTYGNKGRVLDPCGGWGGRMFGFLASKCKEYECCDPNTLTCNGLERLASTYSFLGKETKVNCTPFEDFMPRENYFDLAFTSPPYFNTEEYSTEDTQSYIRYPEYDKWVDGFLNPMICKCRDAVKSKGYVIINIANTKTGTTLEEDTVRLALEAGLEHEYTLKMVLSSIAGKGIKYEPIFVFRKL